MSSSWTDALASLEVENIYVYVGDAVRWDFTPTSILERGIDTKTIASSTHSPPSFASLVTGEYPVSHGVRAFTNRIPDSFPRIFDIDGYNSRFVNSVQDEPSDVDPIFSVLGIEPPTVNHPFEDLEEPFVAVERGPGGHAPYGDSTETAREYFERRRGTPAATFKKEYQETVESDAKLFAERLANLATEGLVENTLVVYTSDHGELLGEGGLLGHNAPMRPELVNVPTVFINPQLQNSSIDQGVFRHVDLVPTILDILSASKWDVGGVSILNEELSKHGFSFYRNELFTDRFPGFTGVLGYDGYWERSGGHTFPLGTRRDRFVILLGKAIKSPKRGYIHRHFPRAAQSYLAGVQTFGSPEQGQQQARSKITNIKTDRRPNTEVALSEAAENQLQDLGYL